MVRFVAPSVLVLATLFETFASPDAPMDGLWWAASLLLVAALFLRYRRPEAALALAAIGSFVHVAIVGASVRLLDLAVPLTLYTLAARTSRRWVGISGLLTVLVGTVAAGFIAPEVPDDPALADGGGLWSAPSFATETAGGSSGTLLAMAALVAAFAFGEAARSRRAHLVTLEQRAADLERERGQREALAAAAERSRIGREMHDVVAHGLSVIVMQAQGGAVMLSQSPDQAAEALEHIIVTGRAAMADMRSLLGHGDRAGSEPRLAPQPGIADLPALIDRIRDAGTPVALDISGQPPMLPTAVDLSAYRIAQEALTNVIKHAGRGARAKVRLDFKPERLELEVTDDGAGSRPDPEAGHGLRGMAERTSALGGQFSSGPLDSGGFGIRASLPLRAAAEPS